MGLGRRNARQHETVGFQKNALDTSTFWEFKPQQQVMTVDGVPGVVTAVLDGPYPGTEEYEVTLDNGLGGGSYTASQLSPLGGTTAAHEHEATGLHLASDDYPEMGSILYDRPPIERMTFNAVRGDTPFDFQHVETDTGGTKFPRRVDLTAHHPETGEEVGSARYFPPKRKGGPISIDDVRTKAPGAGSALLNEIENRHPGSTTKFLHEVKRNNNNPDVTGHAHERAGNPSDWDTHYPNVADTIHRGIALKLPSYSARVLNSAGNSKEDHLAEIHSAMPEGPNVGTHWTEDEHAARLFAHNAVSDYRTTIPVVLHAAKPERRDIETRQTQLYRGGVFPYGDPHSSENEIPVRRGRGVKVTGISWKPDAPHPEADEHGWLHHTYPEPKEHTAARSEFEGHDRAVDAELPDEIHRGFSLRLSPEDHEALHDESRPASERAQILMNHYHDMHERNRDGQNLGRHWSTDSGVARGFSKQKAYNASPYDFNALEPTSTQVVFHAQTPSTKSMISSPRTRDKYTILPHSHGEQEVPVRRNTTLNINGVSWARNEPGSEMTRHDFEQPLRMKAAMEDLTDEDTQEAEPELPPCAYCGSDQMEIAGDTGRAQQARCQVCGGMMSAPYGLQFKPELIGDPSNHPKDDPDPASGGVPGAANMRVPVKRMNDSDYTASLHVAYGDNDGTTATKHVGFAGYVEGHPDTRNPRQPFDDEDARDIEKDQAIGVNGALGYLRRNVSSKNPGFWHEHAEIKDVPLHEPIYSTQPRVVDEHVQRYMDNPSDETAHTKLWKAHGADEPEYPGTHMPMFIRHEGRTYVHDGHHRVAAALMRKDPSIKGYMYDADQKGIPTNWQDERDPEGFYDRSQGFSKYSAWHNTDCDFDFSTPEEALDHELMHHDQDICVATHAHRNSHTASIDEPGWGLFRTASDEEDTSYRMQHQAPDADYGAPLHDVENMMPGFYDRPHQYNFGQEHYWDSADKILKAKGNPEKKVRIYRALPAEHAGKGFNTGDWVSTSKDYARTHGMDSKGSKHDWPVISTVVPAKHLHTEGDVHEWAYNGPHNPNASVAFKGGYHQEVRQRADGSIAPVQRKANPFKDRANELKEKGYSFSHYRPGNGDPNHTVTAFDAQDNWAGMVKAHENGEVHHVDIEPEHAHEPLEQHMRDMIARETKTGSLHEANERDWCTFRHNARCNYPGPADESGLRLSTPQDRGPCAWDYWQQQVCPISEPGPMALMQAKGSLVNDDIRDPEFRFHFTASWSDVRAKAKRIRSEGKVNITVATHEGVGGEVKGDHHVYETLLTYVPGTAKVGAWECGCKWAAFAWGRSPAYRRFEGRMCSHALAMQFEAQARGMFGRAVEPNVERPKWLRHHTPVVTQYERDSGENLTRRAVPPGNMRRTYEGAHPQVYLRFGKWPEDERSHNNVMGWKEDGVSVYDLDHHGEPKDPDEHMGRWHEHDESCGPECDLDSYNEDYGNDTGEEMRGRVHRAERNRYNGTDRISDTGHLVTGDEVGVGHDGEPLLRNVKRVGDWIDHRHLFIPSAKPHSLARSPYDEGYEQPKKMSGRTAAEEPINHLEIQRLYDKIRDEEHEKHQDDATYAENYEPLHKSDLHPEEHPAWRFERNTDVHPTILEQFGIHQPEFDAPRHTDASHGPVPLTQYKHPSGREPLHLDEHGNSWRRHYEWETPESRYPKFKGWSGPHSASETIDTHPTWSTSGGYDDKPRQQHMRTMRERMNMTGVLPGEDYDEITRRKMKTLRDSGWGVISSLDVEGVYGEDHSLDLAHPPVYAQVIEQLPEIGPVEAMKWMAALGMTHAAARAVLKDASAELATGQLHYEASLRLLAEEHEHGEVEKKRCPDCGSMISVNDEKCPHCHHVFMKHEHHHGAKTPAEGDLMSRGMVIGGNWDRDAVHRVMNGQATAHDLLHHIDKEDVGDFWYPHEPHLSRDQNLSGAKDFARAESSEHPAEDLDRDHPIGEVGMVLVGHKPAGWNPENNPDHGLLGNSYIPHSADVPLHEIHYQDHHGDWHSADASGHSVHVTGGGYDEPTQHVAAQAKPPSVSGVALKAADTGRVLMLQRGLHDEDDPAAGTWEFPGGHHEEGDRTSLDAGIREWEEETGHPFPEGGVVHHTWTSPSGVYQGHVVVIPEEGAVQFGHGRQVVNPDNPDGDQHEQAAWWDPDHARKNPALRQELKTGTPWKEIKAAGNSKTASIQPEYSVQQDEEGPTFEAHSGGQNVGYLTTHDKGDHVFFDGLYVHPNHRGSGIGRDLMNHALDYHQGREIRLKPEPYVEEGQEHAAGPSAEQLQRFYSGMGFQPAGEYMTRTAATADPLYGLEEASPMSPPQHSTSTNPASSGWATTQDPHSWDDPEENSTNFGALPSDGFLGSLHDQPEPALPSTDGAEAELADERDNADPSQYDENDAELTPNVTTNTTVASAGSTQDIVARFQATAGARALGGGGDSNGGHHAAQQANNKEIANAAKQFLTKSALKDFNFAEQQELINEGARDKTMARNSDVLKIQDTHYAALEAALAAEDALEDSAELFA